MRLDQTFSGPVFRRAICPLLLQGTSVRRRGVSAQEAFVQGDSHFKYYLFALSTINTLLTSVCTEFFK